MILLPSALVVSVHVHCSILSWLYMLYNDRWTHKPRWDFLYNPITRIPSSPNPENTNTFTNALCYRHLLLLRFLMNTLHLHLVCGVSFSLIPCQFPYCLILSPVLQLVSQKQMPFCSHRIRLEAMDTFFVHDFILSLSVCHCPLASGTLPPSTIFILAELLWDVYPVTFQLFPSFTLGSTQECVKQKPW
jgi:hypothetical protein